jgi:hypothetical protein
MALKFYFFVTKLLLKPKSPHSRLHPGTKEILDITGDYEKYGDNSPKELFLAPIAHHSLNGFSFKR